MEQKQILAGIAVVLVVVAGGAGAVFLLGGNGGASGGAQNGGGNGGAATPATPISTGTVYNMDSGTATGTATQPTPPFSFEIVQIESCGSTCRNVTATLYNNQDQKATGVQVYTRIYAGNNTQDDNLVWQGTEQVGTMQAGGTYTSTQQVDLSYGEAYSVKQHDGWITILTTVESDDTTITFKNRRDVA